MSINMTQVFEFETDDIQSLEAMLRTISDIQFRLPDDRANGKRREELLGTRKFVVYDENVNYFDDGKYESYLKARPSFPKVFETRDRQYIPCDVDRTHGGASILRGSQKTFTDIDEAADFANG